MANEPLIEVNNLNFTYEQSSEDGKAFLSGSKTLSDINLKINSGTITVLIGPSGCGKTTLTRCLTGVIPKIIKGEITGEVSIIGFENTTDAKAVNNNESLGGKVIVTDKDVKIEELSQHIGLVMQEPDHQIVMTTVEDDIAFGPENLMVLPEKVRSIVDETILKLGLSGKDETDPSAMSGGEKQRLAIGGILAMQPRIMVFDEPVSSLDKAGKEMFISYVKILRDAGKTVIIVEHDFEMLDFADTWVLIKNGNLMCVDAPSNVPKQILERELWL